MDRQNFPQPVSTVDGPEYITTSRWRSGDKEAPDASHMSDVRSFTTPAAALDTPELISPANTSVEIPADTLFVWNSVAGATAYRLQISSWSTVPPSIVLDTTLNATRCAVRNLPLLTKCSWSVMAYNTSDSCAWSTVWTFTTLKLAPGITRLFRPVDNSAGVPTSFTLQWYPHSDVSWYRIQVSTDDRFVNMLFDTTGVIVTSWFVSPLPPGTTCFWRVRGENTAGAGPWSTEWRFTTKAVVGVEDDMAAFPREIRLEQNFPNPFHDQTTIRLQVGAVHAPVSLKIYDAFGRESATLVEEVLAPGAHSFAFILRSTDPLASSGSCFLRMTSMGKTATIMMLHIR